jgi:hypothetical protein
MKRPSMHTLLCVRWPSRPWATTGVLALGPLLRERAENYRTHLTLSLIFTVMAAGGPLASATVPEVVAWGQNSSPDQSVLGAARFRAPGGVAVGSLGNRQLHDRGRL